MTTIKMFEPLPRGSSVKDKLDAYSVADPNSGCWLWLASLSTRGYGSLSINGRTQLAHRVAYEEYIGPIPGEMFVCHHCDTPICINPDHLFLGNHQDNMDDKARKRRGTAGGDHPNATVTNLQIMEIIDLLKFSKISQKAIGAKYNVTPNTIYHINRGRAWAGVTGATQESPVRDIGENRGRGRLRGEETWR